MRIIGTHKSFSDRLINIKIIKDWVYPILVDRGSSVSWGDMQEIIESLRPGQDFNTQREIFDEAGERMLACVKIRIEYLPWIAERDWSELLKEDGE